MANTPLKKCTECKQEKTFDSFTTSNHMLGLADDNIETLEKAMTYLKEYQGRKYE